MDWSNFYLVTAGAAATLMGLLFVAVQFNLEALRDPTNRWRAIAGSTFSFYLLLFILPLLLLIPGLDSSSHALIIFIAVGFGAIRAVRTWLPVWNSVIHTNHERILQTAWLLVAPLLVYAALGLNGLELYRGLESSRIDTGIAFCLVGLFAIALRNSWNLLVDASLEKQSKERK